MNTDRFDTYLNFYHHLSLNENKVCQLKSLNEHSEAQSGIVSYM